MSLHLVITRILPARAAEYSGDGTRKALQEVCMTIKKHVGILFAGAGCMAGPILFILSISLFAGYARAETSEPLEVRAERASQLSNKTVAIRHQILRMALQASGRSFVLKACDYPDNQMSDMRYTLMVRDNRGCNVVSTSGGAARTSDLLLVPVPIYLGAGGYRLMLINKNARAKLEAVQTLEDLIRVSIGSGTTWIDTEIMRSAGLTVETSEYENLFSMLQIGRFDAYSRSILEVLNESTMTDGKDNIEIDKHLLLHYPNDLFFYVSPKTPEIQAALSLGLERLYRTGKLMEFLRKIVGPPKEFADLGLSKRIRVDIPNLYLRVEEAAAIKKYSSAWVR